MVFWPGSLDISTRGIESEAIGIYQEHGCASGRICLDCLCSLGISSSLLRDQVLTVGETVQADTAISSTVNAPVFSTTLYTGDGALSKVINTGIDNTGKSLLWFKNRDFAQWNTLVDTIRGDTSALYSNESSAEDTASKRVNDFLSDGVNITSNATVNEPGDGHVVWNFRAAPGFFDVLSWSGNSFSFSCCFLLLFKKSA